MTSTWVESYLGLIFQLYGLAFFVLGVTALLGMRRDRTAGLGAHLGWLASFGMLHGLQEFIDGERLHNPATWLTTLGIALMLSSFATLLEFGRRLWNERPGTGRRLAAPPLYATAGLGTVVCMLGAPEVSAGLELGARYLLGAPGAALAGIALFIQTGATARVPDTTRSIHWLRISALAMLGYAALSLFLSPESGRLLADWLPTTADFLATTGLPVQLARALCAVLMAVGFVYRCRNDQARHHDESARQAERNLLIKEAAIANANSAISLAGMDGALTYANQAFAELWGLASPEDALGRSALSFWDDPEQAEILLEALIQKTGRYEGELVARRADGSLLDVQVMAKMVIGHDGEPVCLIGSFVDVSARNQAQQALRQERNFAQNLVDTAPVIVLLLDPRGIIRHVNPYFEKLTGYRLDEIAGKEWFASFLPARDQARVRDLFASAIQEQPVRGNVNPVLTRSGEEREIEWHATVLRDDDGQMTGLLSIGMDVTERKQAETALVEQAQHTQAILDNMVDSIITIDANGIVQSFNPAAIRIFGYTENEVLGQNVSMLMPNPYRDAHDGYLRNYQRTKVARIIGIGREVEGRRKDGSLFPMELAISEVVKNEEPLYVGMVRDISERKQFESQLRELNQTLEQRVASRTTELERELLRNAAILGTAIEGFFSADASGRIQQANPAFCTMLGYEESELLAMSIPDIEAVESHEETAAHIDKVLARGYDRFDTRHRRKDGKMIEVEVSVSLVTLDDEPIFYAFTRDIGPRKAAEAALRTARDEAERANDAKSDFLSRMSHELRTPLNAILGFTQVLQLSDEQPLSAQQDDNVREIHQAGEHLLALVNEVLDLAQIESGRLELSLEPVALCPVIEHCVAQIEPTARARDIQPTLKLHAPCTVMADPARLQRVLLSLLSNAVKYNREGGAIEVECASVAGQRVRVSVRDTGRGLSTEQQARLFRPFERLESAYEGIEGAGVGLALARQLIDGMRGTIGVDSIPGEGSTFWFELPLDSASVPADTPAATTRANTVGEKRTVLYVEDSPANLRLVQRILDKHTDIKLIAVENAEDGLVLAGREHPDLILLDINLPGMDGFEALACLRADPATRAIPVIAITANAMPRDIERGRVAGFDDYLTKPLDIAQFLDTVQRCLAGDAS